MHLVALYAPVQVQLHVQLQRQALQSVVYTLPPLKQIMIQ